MLEFLWSVGGFLVAISVLVAFHEYGHFWVARRCGVKVLRYSLGFGKIIWSRFDKNGVEWTLSALPLGGYVKMLDEREGEVAPAERHMAFNTQPLFKRTLIVAAGPAFNFMLAIVLYWWVFVLGVEGQRPLLAEPPAASAAARAGLQQGEEILRVNGRTVATWQSLRTELIDEVLNGRTLPLQVKGRDGAERTVELSLAGVRVDPEFLFDDLGLNAFQPKIPPLLAEVVRGSPADEAGIQAQDLLLSYNGIMIESWQQWALWLRAHPGEVVELEIRRGTETLDKTLIIGQSEHGVGKFGARVEVPAALWQDLRAEDRLGPVDAVPAALRHTGQMSGLTLKMLWRMVLGDVSVKNVSGPIQIAQVAGFSAQIGLVSFLSFMAVVSVSLGVLNLLPVPLLDGGHLLFYAAEAIRGSPLPDKVLEMGQRLGLMFLAGLMGLAFYNDIMRLISQ